MTETQGRQGVDYIATFDKRDRSLTYWQSRNTSTTVHCDSLAAARATVESLCAAGNAVSPQRVVGA